MFWRLISSESEHKLLLSISPENLIGDDKQKEREIRFVSIEHLCQSNENQLTSDESLRRILWKSIIEEQHQTHESIVAHFSVLERKIGVERETDQTKIPFLISREDR